MSAAEKRAARELYKAECKKPADASDLKSEPELRAEVVRLRALLRRHAEDDARDDKQEARLHDSYVVERKLHNMRETDVFVLDNSLRETTVASVYGHTIEGKYRILDAIRCAGMRHMIVGAFGPTRRVDENFIESLRARGQLREDEHYYAFSEFKDSDAPWFEGARKAADAGDLAVPYGLNICKKLGIHNVVIEVDITALWDEDKGGVDGICQVMRQRTEWCRSELSPSSNVFFNIRDFQLAWPKNPQRVLDIVAFLAKLPPLSRPTGLNYEDQNGSWIPAVMCDATESVRRVMVENGWASGHLLLHVHKGYGLSDASQLAAIGAGATGIWCGVSANGAMTGHASSIVTLTNLARLGNRHVRRRFNFVELRRAAIEVHKVNNKEEEPPYMTEVYGKGALDLIWGGGLMANQWESEQMWSRSTDEPFELQKLLGIEPRIRITTMAGPAMLLSKLTDLFRPVVESSVPAEGQAPDDLDARWPRLADGQHHIGHEIHDLIHADLRNSQMLNYNHELGLLEVFTRAYENASAAGKLSPVEKNRTSGFKAAMQSISSAAAADLDDHPLIQQLTERFNIRLCDGSSEHADQWTFDRFYPEFLEPHTHDMKVAERLFQVLDTDGSGTISIVELLVAAKWTLREFGEGAGKDRIDSLYALMQKMVQEWLVPESLIAEMCLAEPEDTVFKSAPTPAEAPRPADVHVLTANTIKDAVLGIGKNVLVAFYQPNCPHCQEFLPHLEDVARAVAEDTDMVIAKFDVSKNSVQFPFEVDTVPTIYFKASTGFPFRYRGLRDKESILSLIYAKHEHESDDLGVSAHNNESIVTGAWKAGIIDPVVGLDGDGTDWYALAKQFASYAESLNTDWTSPSVLAQRGIQKALGGWLKEKISVIKSTKNLQLDLTIDGERNPLLAPADATDPCWKTTVLYNEEREGIPVLKMALLAWNPRCASKIHDHPLACWEAHLHGPPLIETAYKHPLHATVEDLWADSTIHPSNPNRWVVDRDALVRAGEVVLGEDRVAFDSGVESLHTLENRDSTTPTFSVHTYIGPYGGNGAAYPPWAQSYVFHINE